MNKKLYIIPHIKFYVKESTKDAAGNLPENTDDASQIQFSIASAA